MSEIINSAINYHSYNATNSDTLIDQVTKVVSVLLPRGLLVGGFNEQGELQMIRYGDYNRTLPTWILDFYEHRFVDEILLSKPNLVIATYIASDKYLVIPEAVYEESAAMKWMNNVFFVEGNEVLSVQRLPEDKAKYVYAYPATIKSLVGRHFLNSKLVPLAAYQFYKPYRSDNAIHCCITAEHAIATFYKNRILHWHQVFEYEKGDDIAYRIKQLCRQEGLDSETLDITCSVTYRGLNPVLNEVAQYFPSMRENDSNTPLASRQWAGTISLLQQLYACAL
jgi:hypothetical protein